MFPCDEIEMWHGHPDLYMNKLEEILNTPDDSDFGYFIEVDLKYPDERKEKTKNFRYSPESKKFEKNDFADFMKKNETRYFFTKKVNL